MEQKRFYENYPPQFILISNIFQIIIYIIGAYIIYQFGIMWMFLYLAFILFLEIKLLRKSCVNCYYYGKYCAFGKGKLCSLFFKKGDSKKFSSRKITCKNIIPDFMVSIIPMILGIIRLIINFDWFLLALLLVLFFLVSFGNSFIRGSLACKYCKQKEIGCPAQKLFNKKK